MLQALQHQDTSTLSHDKAIAVLVKRNRCTGWVFCCRKSRQRLEATDGKWRNGCLSTTGQHHILVAKLDFPVGITEGIIGRSTGCDHTLTDTIGTYGHGNIPCCHIWQSFWQGHRANPFWSLLIHALNLLFNFLDPTNPCRKDDTKAVAV